MILEGFWRRIRQQISAMGIKDIDGESDVFVMSVLVGKLQKGNHCEQTSRAYLLIQAE